MCVCQLKDKPIRDLLEEEYLGTTEDRNEIRKVFTKLLGDMIFTIPAITTAKAHRGQREEDYVLLHLHCCLLNLVLPITDLSS